MRGQIPLTPPPSFPVPNKTVEKKKKKLSDLSHYGCLTMVSLLNPSKLKSLIPKWNCSLLENSRTTITLSQYSKINHHHLIIETWKLEKQGTGKVWSYTHYQLVIKKGKWKERQSDENMFVSLSLLSPTLLFSSAFLSSSSLSSSSSKKKKIRVGEDNNTTTAEEEDEMLKLNICKVDSLRIDDPIIRKTTMAVANKLQKRKSTLTIDGLFAKHTSS